MKKILTRLAAGALGVALFASTTITYAADEVVADVTAPAAVVAETTPVVDGPAVEIAPVVETPATDTTTVSEDTTAATSATDVVPAVEIATGTDALTGSDTATGTDTLKVTELVAAEPMVAAIAQPLMVSGTADLTLALTASAASGYAGSGATFTLTYANIGAIPSSGANVKITLPAPMLSALTGWVNIGGNLYQYNLGTLAPGATGSLQYSVTLTGGGLSGANYITTAIIAGSATDALPSNNVSVNQFQIFSYVNTCGCSGPNALKGKVAIDHERNKIMNTTDTALAGQTVQLFKDGLSTAYSMTTTDASGNYLFDNLPNGSYKVVLTASTGSYTNERAIPGTYFSGTTDNLLVISGVNLSG